MVDSVLPANQTIESLSLWSKILLHSMKEAKLDLSTRQMAILLSVYLDKQVHSVKSLSETLGISKAAVCRALDVLCKEGLVKRKREEEDKRQVSLTKTIKGMCYLSEIAEIVQSETSSQNTLLHEAA